MVSALDSLPHATNPGDAIVKKRSTRMKIDFLTKSS
jgi:hypothetical protein